MNGLYVENYTPYLGFVICILTVFPIITNIIVMKDKKANKEANRLIYAKNILLAIIMIMICINKNFNIARVNFIAGIMLFFYILYYELYIKFLLGEKTEESFYTPFLKYIKVPIQLTMSFGVIFASIWSTNILLVIFSIIYGIINIYISYKYYMKTYENTELKKKMNLNKAKKK